MQLNSSATLTSKALAGGLFSNRRRPSLGTKLEFRERSAASISKEQSVTRSVHQSFFVCCVVVSVGYTCRAGVGPRHGTLVPVLLKGKCIVCTYKIIKPQSFVFHYYCCDINFVCLLCHQFVVTLYNLEWRLTKIEGSLCMYIIFHLEFYYFFAYLFFFLF